MKKGILFASIVLIVGVIIGVIGFILYRKPAVVETLPDVPAYTDESSEIEESIRYKVPESLHTEVIEEKSKNNNLRYSDTSICAVFGDDIRGVAIDTFGEYLPVLQDAYQILEDVGYEYFTAFHTDLDTVVSDTTHCEFTILLPGARGRFNIEKSGSEYKTTFRMLDDNEYVAEFVPDEEEEDSNVGINYVRRRSTSPKQIDGYTIADESSVESQYVLQTSDYLDEAVPFSVIKIVREKFGSSEALGDTIDFLLATTGESQWMDMSCETDSDSVTLTEGDYLFILTGTDVVLTDIYVKNN